MPKKRIAGFAFFICQKRRPIVNGETPGSGVTTAVTRKLVEKAKIFRTYSRRRQ